MAAATGQGHVFPREAVSIKRPGLQSIEFFNPWLRGVEPMMVQYVLRSELKGVPALHFPNSRNNSLPDILLICS